MPDLRTELQKLADLKFDDSDEEPATESLPDIAEQVGVSEMFFNLVRDNPGLPRHRLLLLAGQAGIRDSSSSSLLTQFVKRGIITAQKTTGPATYFTVGSSYVKGYIRQAKPSKAQVNDAQVQALTVSVEANSSVDEMLDSMSITKARALYDALKKIFGG
jgi:hypothetical protein